ncbi:MAG: hypothetical protein AABW65_02765 [Nanoarchaeota archaeon]
MKEEIIGGLKNAIERGYSLEEAVQTFINAGYNPFEVNEVAKIINAGAISVLSPKKQDIQPKTTSALSELSRPPETAFKNFPSSAAQEPGKKSNAPLITILIILIFLIILVLLGLLFGDKILKLFSKIILAM